MSVQRIAALLAKAERTDNVAEADAYLMKAQALATASSIDLAFARAATEKRERRAEPESRTLTIGERGKRANKHLIALFAAIALNNDARVDVANDSTFVVVYGMPSDLDVIETMFTVVAIDMTARAQEWVRAGLWQGETYLAVRRERGRLTRRKRPHNAQTARAAFFVAYVERIDERLTQARASALDSDPRIRASDPSSAVVLREKTAEITDFHRRTSDARGAWGGYRGAVRDRGKAAQAGRSAASRARLSAHAGLTRPRSVTGSADA